MIANDIHTVVIMELQNDNLVKLVIKLNQEGGRRKIMVCGEGRRKWKVVTESDVITHYNRKSIVVA